MSRANLAFALAATLFASVSPLHAGVRMDKAHLPKKPFKIYDGHLTAQQKNCLKFALKQWVYYDTAPLEGDGNRGSSGATITQPGGEHNLDDNGADARGQRSLNAGERGALKKAYGDASPFAAGGDPTQPAGAGWFTSDEGAADLSIEPVDEVPGEEEGTLGRADFGLTNVPVPGTSLETQEKGKLKSTPAIIWMKNKPTEKKDWCYPTDTNNDGWITNQDKRCPKGTLDYYMIIKHELAHYFSFSHDGKNFDYVENPPPVYENPQSLCARAMGPFGEKGACEATGSEFSPHAGRIYFSSDRPGGLGGWDLWTATWNDTLGSWGSPVNCGTPVNTPFDEIDPFSIVSDAGLMWSSNRPGGAGGFDLWMAQRAAIAEWDSIGALTTVNTPFNETGPCEGNGRLFFASDRPGGFGGSDLYAAALSSDSNIQWDPAVNLGPDVNSIANEIDPEVSTDEGDSLAALYFASDTTGGAGAMDLYRTLESLGTWSPPENLGPMVNTPFNETGPSVALSGAGLYFASERVTGHGNWDIFYSRNLAPRPNVLWNGDVQTTAGSTVRVEFDVANDGNAGETFLPQAYNTAGWPMAFAPQPLALAPGEQRTLAMLVQVPGGEPVGARTTVVMRAMAFPINTGPGMQGPGAFDLDTARVEVVDPSLVSAAPAPAAFALRAAPNPFRAGTWIEFTLPAAGEARVELFDVAGRRVKTIARGPHVAGPHLAWWDGRDESGRPCAAGVLFCRLLAGGRAITTTLLRTR